MQDHHIEELLAILWWALAAACWKLGYLWLAIPASAMGTLCLFSSFVILYHKNLREQTEKKKNGQVTINLHTMN